MTKQTFVSKVVSLLFNMVFRLVTPGDLPDPGIEPRSPALQADETVRNSSIIHASSSKSNIFIGKGYNIMCLSLCSPSLPPPTNP